MTLTQAEWVAMLRYIARFTAENGFPPTRREIRDHFDISSLSVVNYRVMRLVEKGYITQWDGQPRTIVLTAAGKEAMRVHKEQIKEATDAWKTANESSLL